ncbi:phenylalanyl-tRNA synthetase beta subunit [Chitinophaga costaii]|uniref:Phenylalanine--tRNA ligase beta subunit n=1 Tax=Chitinophaga costaii TaxID=1335309 RepID=A0A1C4BHI5_9BACT|nr:phenylalanine--tRNA ligase subunit beta [Chitinophaga costaii]PUZ27612.1 phenylalanine--tRNA ligase subunit beta [Chitinophaga costaii]SCC06188.1 phenylalanyl-tRNA synthetase beta subunit [Chitinophaga costaii]
MTISYNWLCDYLPVRPTPEELSVILTRIGLEVESLEKIETVKGSLEGLVIGEVLTTAQHPNADKLKLTTVNIGGPAPLQIVCGAPNVAPGQKVVVATIGTTIYPIEGEPMTMKKAKIRGEESQGMLCAEDEIGLGAGHAGILVLAPSLIPGTPAREVFNISEDYVYEIGLTPNRMDAMSHLGVARDVCAYLNNENNNQAYSAKIPAIPALPKAAISLPISVSIVNTVANPRYAGLSITGVKTGPSPDWLKNRLQAIGVRPISNIVDITNFVLHETGQPLHAFDATAIKGGRIVVKNLPQGTPFITLDDKERKLDAADLMITNGEGEPMAIAGVFGGAHSGVQATTTSIFLESACFAPASIRPTSFRHGLRTDAATRFEKGVDISQVPYALQRAAALICELAGGQIASDMVDIYPAPKPKTQVTVTYAYIHRLSGKAYPVTKIHNILVSLGFDILAQTAESLTVAVPYSKPDISLPADIVEEVMRIDGLDNIEIPAFISIAPSLSAQPDKERIKEKIAEYLAASGFHEIFTNSITNSKYYPEELQNSLVRMLNSLSADLDVMRPSMLETGLESVAHNLNRKNEDLLFFEFGKTYGLANNGYTEHDHLSLYLSGHKTQEHWQHKPELVDFYFLKGFVINIFTQLGIKGLEWEEAPQDSLAQAYTLKVRKNPLAVLGAVTASKLKRFDIKQAVWFADIDWQLVLQLVGQHTDKYFTEIPKFPAVRRDLALVLDKQVKFAAVAQAAASIKSPLLQQMNLFDVFESEKLGTNKKSYAVSFTFQDVQKTLTDKEIDNVMDKLVKTFTAQLQAEIRK